MLVRIIKCKQQSYWYSKHIGKTFKVKTTLNGGQYVVEKTQKSSTDALIDPEDCAIVPEP